MGRNVFRAKTESMSDQINKKKLQIQEWEREEKFSTHFSDRLVGLVHDLHQLLGSVVKDILHEFDFSTSKTMIYIIIYIIITIMMALKLSKPE